MLIDEPGVLTPDPILMILSGGKSGAQLRTGCYEIGHFGSSHFLRNLGLQDAATTVKDTWESLLSVGSYGVCDSVDNLLQKCPELEADPVRQFVVTFTRINKCDQPEEGGWRWHKWGGYIGEQVPTTEYLFDEPEIETVYRYHIYEKSATRPVNAL